jgi:hypothetical protein
VRCFPWIWWNSSIASTASHESDECPDSHDARQSTRWHAATSSVRICASPRACGPPASHKRERHSPRS